MSHDLPTVWFHEFSIPSFKFAKKFQGIRYHGTIVPTDLNTVAIVRTLPSVKTTYEVKYLWLVFKCDLYSSKDMYFDKNQHQMKEHDSTRWLKYDKVASINACY